MTSMALVLECPAGRAISSTGAPDQESRLTNLSAIPRGAQSLPMPAALQMALNCFLTLPVSTRTISRKSTLLITAKAEPRSTAGRDPAHGVAPSARQRRGILLRRKWPLATRPIASTMAHSITAATARTCRFRRLELQRGEARAGFHERRHPAPFHKEFRVMG